MALATYVKFEKFVQDLAEKVHNLNTDTLNIYLTNTAPNVATHTVKSDLAEIATGNGYTGPQDTQNTGARAAGVYTVTGTKIVITASGNIATFRYIVLYNDTPGTKPLIGYWDYGLAVSMTVGEVFSIKFNSSDTTGTIITLT